MDEKALFAAACALDLDLASAQIQQFAAFEESLYAANKSMNLTRVPREECWSRHFIDSLLFHDLIPNGSRVLDIGTGPGFPAWPLACARPDLQVVALDSSGKMLGFLKQHLLPNLKVVKGRAEELNAREEFDAVTGRAVARLPVFMEIAAAAAKIKGVVIPMRTARDAQEIEACNFLALGLKLEKACERSLPIGGEGDEEVHRLFPLFRKFKKTPVRFPRSWAEIKRGAGT
ncbi:MAG TPA: 16S rRNA (guanine(527)-N(7))-methyltransferase RsmG [Fimbriimonadaceae bacterium]|jgi:16S rRNA (guanine527-N7)-methyltransferase